MFYDVRSEVLMVAAMKMAVFYGFWSKHELQYVHTEYIYVP
jgi:hypothetical protein